MTFPLPGVICYSIVAFRILVAAFLVIDLDEDHTVARAQPTDNERRPSDCDTMLSSLGNG